MDITEIDKAVSVGIEKMKVPDLSNLLFDGKGEIELNRRLSLSLENIGVLSRVEHSVPEAKGSRTHSDIVVFGDDQSSVLACIECKSCITPDVFRRRKPNNNFTRIQEDTQKYAVHDYSPLYILMWAIHWDEFPLDQQEDFGKFKYYQNHKRMHEIGFNNGELENSINDTLVQVGLGKIIHQSRVGPFDEWRGCKASVIATVSRVF